MDVKRLTFDLAVYEVSMTDNWCALDYAKEHFEKGAFIVHDGVTYQFCSWNGGNEYVYTVGIPNDVILGVMAEEMNKRLFSKIGGNELVSSFEAWIRSGCPSVEKVNEMSWLK